MLYTSFFLGLISSLHCVGMCGPIAMMLPVDHANPAKKATQIITYQLGRLLAYGSLGLLFGLLGKGFFIAGFQQKLSVFIGILMIIAVVLPERVFANYNFSKPVFRMISKLKQTLGSNFKKKSYSSLFTIGFLNGLLPCGMVYVALFGAVAMQSAMLGVSYMLLFGLGTVPLMSLVVYMKSFLSLSARNRIQKAIPFVAVIIGILFIMRGLGLGIPYVSPTTLSLFVQQTPNCH
ncbi:sulfite exporter TauE/SafE family protein [Flavobacterium sp. TSSA_36]|uniref:sulfite exporter TauE/SafE family protein n=1 Tax=Flavobacterium sp. TSSA_36 TaxID=3447669 RepID=UPI003F3303C8